MSETAVVARYAYRHEAEFAANVLHGAGIPAFPRIDDVGGLYVGMTFTNPARVIVRREDLEAARDTLRDAGLLHHDDDQ